MQRDAAASAAAVLMARRGERSSRLVVLHVHVAHALVVGRLPVGPSADVGCLVVDVDGRLVLPEEEEAPGHLHQVGLVVGIEGRRLLEQLQGLLDLPWGLEHTSEDDLIDRDDRRGVGLGLG